MSIFNFTLNCREFYRYLKLLWTRRELTWELTKREFSERHAGQMLGMAWGFAHPIMLIFVYIFMFQFVFKAKLDNAALDSPRDFTVYILCGLIPWLALAEVLGKAPLVILLNRNLVKQVIFPVEILPAKTVFASFFTELVLFGLLFIYCLIQFTGAPWTMALVPFLLALQLLQMMGICLLLATLGSYFRDLKEIVQVFCLVNIYLMPVFYLPDWVPRLFKPILYLNPFSYQTWCFQDAIFFGRFEHPWAWGAFGLLSFLSLALGYRVFNKLKQFMGNVL